MEQGACIRFASEGHQNLLIGEAGPFINLLLVATEPWFPLFSLANFCYGLANVLPIEGSDRIRLAESWGELQEGKWTP